MLVQTMQTISILSTAYIACCNAWLLVVFCSTCKSLDVSVPRPPVHALTPSLDVIFCRKSLIRLICCTLVVLQRTLFQNSRGEAVALKHVDLDPTK